MCWRAEVEKWQAGDLQKAQPGDLWMSWEMWCDVSRCNPDGKRKRKTHCIDNTF